LFLQLATFSAEDAYVQCVNIVAETSEYAAAFKPNIAFFEQFGAEGIEALKKVVSEIPPSIPIVLDCKRGDIDTTAIVS
jgi:orotidine-5'-phosphate decarboxylase